MHRDPVLILWGIPAVTFGWAGLVKLRRPFPASLAIVRFGLAKRVRPWVGRLAGLCELAAGVVVLVLPFRPWAYCLPAALALLFVAMTARALRRRERFDCACLGTRSDSPIGPLTVLRAAMLLAICLGAVIWALERSDEAVSFSARAAALALSCLVVTTVQLGEVISTTRPFRE
jgi:hypothetical protein